MFFFTDPHNLVIFAVPPIACGLAAITSVARWDASGAARPPGHIKAEDAVQDSLDAGQSFIFACRHHAGHHRRQHGGSGCPGSGGRIDLWVQSQCRDQHLWLQHSGESTARDNTVL
jgi:hypothetical protein